MSVEALNAIPEQTAETRVAELELENQQLREQLKAYEMKYGPLKPVACSEAGPATAGGERPGAEVLSALQAKVRAEREAASAKFLALMSNFQKRLKGNDEDEHVSVEETFSLPSALNTGRSDVSMDSPTSFPASPQ